MQQDIYQGSPDNPKTAAWLAYVTFIGWLLAYFAIYPSQRTSYNRFHLRQALLIHCLSLILKIVYSFTINTAILFFVVCALCVLLFLLWLKGFLDALNDRTLPLPLLGNWAQQVFAGI